MMRKPSSLVACITLVLLQPETVAPFQTGNPRLRSVRVSKTGAWIAGREGVFHSTDGGQQWSRLPVSLAGTRPIKSMKVEWRTGLIAWADSQNAVICSPDEMISVAVGPAAQQHHALPLD